MNIVLIGFMGAGKSTIAKKLSKQLKMDIISCDQYLMRFTNRKSISEIFSLDGEKVFRTIEHKAMQEISKRSNVIIDTGGGVIMNQQNITLLKDTGTIFYLRVPFAEIKNRLTQDGSRPLFKNIEKAKDLYMLREPMYLTFSDYKIECSNKTPQRITKEIIEIYERTN